MAQPEGLTKKPMIPLHVGIGDPELDRLLRPGTAYQSPSEVVQDRSLSIAEKRAILSSWASDACSVESIPALRQSPFGENPVRFDDIMDALRSLDVPSALGGIRAKLGPKAIQSLHPPARTSGHKHVRNMEE